MSLLAESLVEEWLNRAGFFTIRGVKEGVGEIDLLGVRPTDTGTVEAWHVEVQVGFRPFTYMTDLTPRVAKTLSKAAGSTCRRSPDVLEECVSAWVLKKFEDPRKIRRRDRLWPGIEWKRVLVHGVFKFPEELRAIEAKGVTLIPLGVVLKNLCDGKRKSFTAAGGDLAELVAFYARNAEDKKGSAA